MDWHKLLSTKRFGQEEFHNKFPHDRTEFQRDYDRLIFSAPFRRLQNKTQVFPLPGSVFVHNRLTHSMEVASVGRSLGNDVSKRLLERHPDLCDSNLKEIGSIVSAACLAHDLGNPPFGHSGENAIATYFSEGDGQKYRSKMSDAEWSDIIHFDGNANTFRLLTHQFIGRRKGGFVMTYSTLASIVKYPFPSTQAGEKPKFGFFQSERESYRRIADELGIKVLHPDTDKMVYARHPLVYLVEAADDICYEVMDIEDAHKLKIMPTEKAQQLLLAFFDKERQDHIKSTFDEVTDINEQIVYLRSSVIGLLEHECIKVFVENEEKILAGEFEGCLLDHISERPRKAYEDCVAFSFSKIYRSKDVVDIEVAGYKIIYTLIDLFSNAVMSPEKKYSQLLLNRVSDQYEIQSPTVYGRIMSILDYISGMTDVFALDLFRKINGTSIPLI
ncbi:MAG: dNTP triphosphohydrolase [Bacteroidaceae bacterium]|nr:dNTP triphosphohydrolase [Bacteroidaceae bacterium]